MTMTKDEKIRDLEAQVESLSALLAEYENKVLELEEKMAFEEIEGALYDKLDKYDIVDVSVGSEQAFGVQRQTFNAILNKMKKDDCLHIYNVPVWKKTTAKLLTRDEIPLSELRERMKTRYILRTHGAQREKHTV